MACGERGFHAHGAAHQTCTNDVGVFQQGIGKWFVEGLNDLGVERKIVLPGETLNVVLRTAGQCDLLARSIGPKHESLEVDSGQELHFLLMPPWSHALCLERQTDAQLQGPETERLR